MLINSKDISDYGCTMLHRNIYPVDVITVEDWLEGAIQPVFVRQQDSFKKLEVVLLLEAESENDAQLQLSELTALAKRCTVEFDDIDDMSYNCTLQTITTERITKKVFNVNISWQSGYAVGKLVKILSPDIKDGKLDIKHKGTAPSALIFELVPIASTIVQVKVGGLTEDGFTIRNVPFGKKLVIDSEKGTIELVDTADGTAIPAIDCYDDCWEMPKLKPGLNTVTFDFTTGYNINIYYKPAYL